MLRGCSNNAANVQAADILKSDADLSGQVSDRRLWLAFGIGIELVRIKPEGPENVEHDHPGGPGG